MIFGLEITIIYNILVLKWLKKMIDLIICYKNHSEMVKIYKSAIIITVQQYVACTAVIWLGGN